MSVFAILLLSLSLFIPLLWNRPVLVECMFVLELSLFHRSELYTLSCLPVQTANTLQRKSRCIVTTTQEQICLCQQTVQFPREKTGMKWCLSFLVLHKEARNSTSVSRFFFLCGDSLTLSSVLTEVPKALTCLEILVAETECQWLLSACCSWYSRL